MRAARYFLALPGAAGVYQKAAWIVKCTVVIHSLDTGARDPDAPPGGPPRARRAATARRRDAS